MSADQDGAALRVFKNLLKKTKNPQIKSVILYNIGLILEKNKKCKKAQVVYNRALFMNDIQDSVVEGQTLWRLSFIKECLQDFEGMLATLKDVQSRVHLLNPEIAYVELNARLALAYEKLGRSDLYESYWLKARKGLTLLNEKISQVSQKKKTFSRLFYSLGNTSSYKLDKKTRYLYLEQQRDLQKYFLRSVEFNEKPWSYRSAKKIINDYKAFIEIMEKTKSKKMAEEILKNIEVLRSQRFPDPKESLLVKKLFKMIDLQSKKVKNYIHDSQKSS